MMDENTIEHIQNIRLKAEIQKRFGEQRCLENFYYEIKQERKKQKQLKKIIKIIVVSFFLLTTVMIVNLDKLSELENKMFYWWSKLPAIVEHPLSIKQ